ncbi:MAG: NrfD/PsrC family molybdoenzyme membrane anchor subunit, partial [Desulfuromonadales bacterium]
MSMPADPHRDVAAANAAMLSSTRPPTWRWYLLATALGAVVACGLYAFSYQMLTGMVVTGINRPVMWGLFIVNFVFWV